MKTKEYKKLHAEWYEFMSGQKDHSKQIASLVRRMEAFAPPILELGSGTGRILVPLLERGLDVCGIDASTDMMDRCRAVCRVKGLDPALHEQSMINFQLPQQFGVILLLSGSLSLFVRFKAHYRGRQL